MKADERLAKAQANDDANIAAFKTGADKAAAKRTAAEEALDAFRNQ